MFGFAKKIGMTRLFIDGKHTPVTVLQFPKNAVVQVKTVEKEGYTSFQVGVAKKRGTKATAGHAKKHAESDSAFLHLSEIRGEVPANKKVFTIADFAEKDTLKITGRTIGRGTTGVMKRHGFGGQPASHGHDHKRAVGSIGAQQPQRVTPGTKMAGRSGNEARSLQASVVAIDAENELLFVAGSIPGANSKYVKVQKVNA